MKKISIKRIVFIGLVFFIGIWLYRVVLGSMLIHSVDFTYSNDYNPKKVTLLLYLGAMKGFEGDEEDYNASNYGYRDLQYLVARGDVENVRLYLRLGGDVNLVGGSKSALYIALSRGDNEMAKILLEYGARVRFDYNFLLLNLLDRKITDEVAELVVNRALAEPNMSAQYLCWASRGLSYNGFSSRAFHLMLERINEPLEDITCKNWGLLYAMLDKSFRNDGFGIDEVKAVFLKAKEQGCKECMTYVARFYHRRLDWVERINVMAEIIYEINSYKINSDTKKEQEMLDLLEFFILNGGDVNSYIPSSYKPETLLENTKYRDNKSHRLESAIALLIRYGAK